MSQEEARSGQQLGRSSIVHATYDIMQQRAKQKGSLVCVWDEIRVVIAICVVCVYILIKVLTVQDCDHSLS
jgi:hypothetical protein